VLSLVAELRGHERQAAEEPVAARVAGVANGTLALPSAGGL
jgi:hypothetical protein